MWEQYTNSKTDLTKVRERLDSISASPVEVTTAVAPKVESKTTTKVDVDVPEDKKSKVLQYLTGFPPTIVPVLSGLLQPQYKIYNSTDTEKAAIIATFQVDFQCSGTQHRG